TLLGPSTVTEKVTLAETLKLMNSDFQLAADFVTAAESAWNRLFEQADPVQQRLRDAIGAVREIGGRTLATTVAGVGDEYTKLRREVFADPIGLAAPNSDFPQRLARVREDLESVAATVTGAADMRADFERRAGQLARLIDRIADLEDAQRTAEADARE